MIDDVLLEDGQCANSGEIDNFSECCLRYSVYVSSESGRSSRHALSPQIHPDGNRPASINSLIEGNLYFAIRMNTVVVPEINIAITAPQ